MSNISGLNTGNTLLSPIGAHRFIPYLRNGKISNQKSKIKT
jgi:hypothetical protein